MFKIKNFLTRKIIIIIIVIFTSILFASLWSVVSGGYDKQNKVILLLKKIIPTKISRKVRDIVFIIPDLKERNKFLSNQVRKYDQGLKGEKFNDEIIISKKNKEEYHLKEFYLPFPRLDSRLGWAGETNSRRAHYFTIFKDKIIVMSGDAETLFFEKKNIFNNKLNEIRIQNNIQNILINNNFKLIGIRDLFIEDKKVYVSLLYKNSKGLSINVYRADINFEKLNFELFFEVKEHWVAYNVYTGGRFSKYKDNEILFTIGYQNVKKIAQDPNSLLGKIISINKLTGDHKVISIGHRNPQGLSYIEDIDIIINSEHGPKGGDEININFQKGDEVPNYGWDISSYGIEYDGTDPYKKSHSEYGFIEPFKYYVPSIGISQIVYMPKKFNLYNENSLYISSLRAESIYVMKINDQFNKIIDEDRIFFNKRIREIEYDKENNLFILLFEHTPSIGILKLKK